MLAYNCIPVFHQMKMFAALIHPTLLCCYLMVMLVGYADNIKKLLDL